MFRAFALFFLSLFAVGSWAASCSNPESANALVPHGAIWKQQTMRRATPPSGFDHVLAWVNAVSVEPCLMQGGRNAITIQTIRLLERNRVTGKTNVIKVVQFSNGEGDFKGELFARVPKWFGGGDRAGPKIDRWNALGGAIEIDVAKAPERVYHAWTDPRSPAQPGMIYMVEVVAKIEGAARLQLGVDYWRGVDSEYVEPKNWSTDECSIRVNNCEGWIGDWFGATNGKFVTLRSPQID